MKVVFAGTPEFAAVALQSLHEAGHSIPLVLTQPDRPAGRGMHLQPSAVKQYALKHGIEVLQPLSLRMDAKDPQRAAEAQAAHERLLATDYDVMVVAAYGLILPRSTLDIRPCLNIHGSLLPRWRGAAPIHRAIEAGDADTGVTIMQMEEGLDTGAMLLIEHVAIGEQDSTAIVHDKLATLGGRMIVQALRKKEEATLDFTQSAQEIGRKIRAFNPFPGAHGSVNGVIVKLWGAEVLAAGSSAPAGEVLAADAQHGIVIACGGGGSLRLTELQKPGGKRLPAHEFIKGFPLEGQRFA